MSACPGDAAFGGSTMRATIRLSLLPQPRQILGRSRFPRRFLFSRWFAAKELGESWQARSIEELKVRAAPAASSASREALHRDFVFVAGRLAWRHSQST